MPWIGIGFDTAKLFYYTFSTETCLNKPQPIPSEPKLILRTHTPYKIQTYINIV